MIKGQIKIYGVKSLVDVINIYVTDESEIERINKALESVGLQELNGLSTKSGVVVRVWKDVKI